MMPLAEALKDHEHEVAFATACAFGELIERLGYFHFPCGVDFDGSTDVLDQLSAPQKRSVQASFPDAVPLQQLQAFIVGLAPKMAEDLAQPIASWKPDLIVRDPLEFGGYIAAEKKGLPYASTSWTTYIPTQFLCPEALLELRRRHGLDDEASALANFDQYCVINFLPHSIGGADSPVQQLTHRYCATPFDRHGEVDIPDWIKSLPYQQTVHATLGTTFNRSSTIFKTIIDAFDCEEINLIITVGSNGHPEKYGPMPGNIRIEKYIPQSCLLPYCDAVIFHGGYNTLFSSLWHGLPMVIIPQGAGDQRPNAELCVKLGAGIILEPDRMKIETVRDAVRNILAETTVSEVVRQVQKEMRNLPPVAGAVKRLESLARTGAPQVVENHTV
jgi:UDP:flavonoid glycosyltransferase YjiC (YdhE family)